LRRSSGTLPGLRDQLPWPEGKPFRILSIDGGGIRGILPAATLTELENRYTEGRSAGDYFDLIAGTSTGGIIAIALSLGMQAREVLDIYLKLGPSVFPRPQGRFLKLRERWRSIRQYRHHGYDPAPLKQELTRVLGSATIGDAQRRLCIPSFDGFTETFIFKTPHHPDYELDWKESMVTVAMATAAAPAYFPIYRERAPHSDARPASALGRRIRYFGDGGVWANSPLMIALVDALACNKLDRRQVHILSLGTGDTELRITNQQIRLGGFWYWREIISSAMHLQSQNAVGQAGLLIGRDQLLRLNAPPMPENAIMLDDYERASSELPPIAEKLVDEHGAQIRARFLFNPAEKYAAFYGPRSLEQDAPAQ
jgi:patatin-like phospholipase/acyl hydrolase